MLSITLQDEIVKWAAEAGRQNARETHHFGEDLDTEGGMGLWQSFQARFPKEGFPGQSYDFAIALYNSVYRAASIECYEALNGLANIHLAEKLVDAVGDALGVDTGTVHENCFEIAKNTVLGILQGAR